MNENRALQPQRHGDERSVSEEVVDVEGIDAVAGGYYWQGRDRRSEKTILIPNPTATTTT